MNPTAEIRTRLTRPLAKLIPTEAPIAVDQDPTDWAPMTLPGLPLLDRDAPKHRLLSMLPSPDCSSSLLFLHSPRTLIRGQPILKAIVQRRNNMVALLIDLI